MNTVQNPHNNRDEILTIGPATSLAFSLSYRYSTIARANSNAVPGPRLVMTLPSITTRPETESPSILSENAGCAVAATPFSRPWGLSTTAGEAHIAAYAFLASACFLRMVCSEAQSRRRSAPGMPPGRATMSNSPSSQSFTKQSATNFIFRDISHCRVSSTDATTTSTPALRSTSTIILASISSDPVPIGTRTRLADAMAVTSAAGVERGRIARERRCTGVLMKPLDGTAKLENML
mmetsp:Transcript_4537/g.8461  ORF Transcript_4537/g.8461 Transcript_4537/m.8461 type:complete len:236 (+) Transcript_4537:514-1221(+)